MEDIFSVDSVDRRNFDQVSRIEAKSVKFDMSMMLDINTDVYPIEKGEKFTMKLTPTLNTDGSADSGYYNPSKQGTIADDYEYIMHGKLFKFKEEGSGKNALTEMIISFGGLIMSLKGSREQMTTSFQLDHKYFLCMKKV